MCCSNVKATCSGWQGSSVVVDERKRVRSALAKALVTVKEQLECKHRILLSHGDLSVVGYLLRASKWIILSYSSNLL